jgi:hypothetical protein
MPEVTDKDMWHLVSIGQEHNESKGAASASLWKIIAAASFIPTKDEQTIYLSWLAVSSMKAEFGKWNTKKPKQKQSNIDDVRSFFDGSTFSNGKGIGDRINNPCSSPIHLFITCSNTITQSTLL